MAAGQPEWASFGVPDMDMNQAPYDSRETAANERQPYEPVPDMPEVVRQGLAIKPFKALPGLPTPFLKDCEVPVPELGYLAQKNAHPRDSRLVFVGNDQVHKYFLDGRCDRTLSVTEFVGCFFSKFDAPAQAVKTFQGRTFQSRQHQPAYDYYQCRGPQDIVKRWNHWRDLGTMLHANIEDVYNQRPVQLHAENELAFKLFETKMKEAYFVNWVPFRTEWGVFDDQLMITGQIDFCGLMRDASGRVVLIDWKRCKSIPECSFERLRRLEPKRGYGCCNKIDSCKYNKYALQLNTYKYLLEKNYGLIVRRMLIIRLHPNLKNKGADVRGVPDWQPLIHKMAECRMQMLREAGLR